MSTSVDDLVISLTIQEGGNLDKLRKQLKSIVGERGQGIGAGMAYLKRDLINIKKNTDFIRQEIGWLTPVNLPSKYQPLSQRKLAGVHLRQIERQRQAIIENFLKTREQDLDTLFSDLQATNIEEAREKLSKVLTQVEETIGEIHKGTAKIPPHKIEELQAFITEIIGTVSHGRELGLGRFRRLSKLTPEKIWVNRLISMFPQAAKFLRESPLYGVKKEALSLPKIQQELGETLPGTAKDFFRTLAKAIRGETTISRSLTASLSPEVVDTLAKLLGVRANQDAIAKKIKEKVESGEGDKLADNIFTELTKNLLDILVTEETKSKISRIWKQEYGKKGEPTYGVGGKIDVLVKNMWELSKVLPEFQSFSPGTYALEAKKILQRGHIAQALRYSQVYGKENVLFIVEEATKEAVSKALEEGFKEEQIIRFPSLREVEERLGLEIPLVNINTEEFRKKMEELTSESNIELLKSIIKSVDNAGKNTGKNFNEVINKLKEILKDLEEKEASGETNISSGDF